jgi:thioredoxin 1
MFELTTANFEEEVKKSATPVLIDFWASWCGPCRALAPVLEVFAEEYAGKVKFGKVNVDEQGELAEEHGIASIPTVILYKNGEIAGKVIGAVGHDKLDDLIKQVL